MRHPQEESLFPGIFDGLRIVSQSFGSVAQRHPEVRLHFERTAKALEGFYGSACNIQSVSEVVETHAPDSLRHLYELLVQDGTAKVKHLVRQWGLFPLPLRAISIPRNRIRPVVIQENRLLATNALLLKNLVPGKGTSKAILAFELYGKI